MAYADLEIRILEKQADGYPLEMTLDRAREFPRGFLDPGFLPWAPSASPAGDGERLFRWLFASEQIRSAWTEVRGGQPQRRIRLRIDAGAPELHDLPWELLRDPGDGAPPENLAATAATPFSRYLAGKWRPGSPILKRPIKILVAIASPANLADYDLADVSVGEEWALIQEACAGLDAELTLLPHPCTLEALEAELRRGYHILHFVGHGFYKKETGTAFLILADQQNQLKQASDEEIAGLLTRQQADTGQHEEEQLRMVYLASCETATRSPADAFRGLAPRLVAAGVPAVLAMQDLVPIQTARRFGTTLYRQILQHGQVDVACNEARSAILTADLPGASIPVLFMRLNDGQLLGWRGKILSDRAEGFWTTLLENIADKWCTPILGPGVASRLLPGQVEMAQKLAAEYSYPFLATQSLPRVAQYVATLDNRRLREQCMRMLISGYRRRMGLKVEGDLARRKLSEIVANSNWSERSRELFENEVHHQLADLELPLYVTTNIDNFMTLALQSRGMEPRRVAVDWRENQRSTTAGPHHDLNPPPSPENPVVLHLYGTDEDPRSMVLTEDDYLDYLARISRDFEHLLPTDINAALASTTLLFLGFRLQDLDLKVILRGLLTNLDLDRWDMLHVAVQIEADVADPAHVAEVTSYFQRYFANSKIDVYWGTTQQFVADLHARWQEYRHG